MTDWTNSVPPNLGVFVMVEVIEGASILSRVVHDVNGDWQFLDDRDVGYREPALLCMEDVVELEPSITELLDLPLGWCATRQTALSRWRREPMFPLDWDQLVSAAVEYTQGCQSRILTEFQGGRWERYDLDPDKGVFTFSSGGVPRVVASMQLVGTFSRTAGTWLWSWANAAVPEQARRDIDWLEAFGRENDYERLVEARWPAAEVDAHELASVACYLFKAEGVYRAPNDDLFEFLVLDDLRWIA